jgi:hypothetical protein
MLTIPDLQPDVIRPAHARSDPAFTATPQSDEPGR